MERKAFQQLTASVEEDLIKGRLRSAQSTLSNLLDVLKAGEEATILIGPEGDFSIEEVRMAEQNGYQAVSLGPSRLRTETAALMAVHLYQVKDINERL